MTTLESVFEDYQKSVQRLHEALQQPKNAFIRDSAIQRFEIAFELAWKTVKTFAEVYHNVRCVSPQTCFREAFGLGLIEYDEGWIELARIRNLTVHTYKEELAEKLYGEFPRALQKFQELEKAIRERIGKGENT
ncbi:MAG: HI0074 family nucleotidyltransferase substrate-binding subunit [Patescibacteria group bacterium]